MYLYKSPDNSAFRKFSDFIIAFTEIVCFATANGLKKIIVATLFFSSFFSSAQEWEWATSFPLNFENKLARDSAENAYITGNFSGAITIGPFTLISPVAASYLVKVDSSGNFIWARKVEMSIRNIAVGNSKIYLVGNFTGTSDFNGNQITANGKDVVLVAYDLNGFFQFEKHATIPGDDTFESIFINDAGRLFVSGETENGFVFNASAVAPGGFVLVLAASGDVIRVVAVSPNVSVREVQNDDNDNIYVLSDYTGTITVGGITHIADPEFGSHFVARFSENGVFSWFIDLGINYYYANKNLTVAKNGDFYLSRDERYREFVISKYTSAGNLKWKKKFGGSSYDFCNHMTLDSEENLYITGNFFHKGNYGGLNIEGDLRDLMFLVKLDSSGAGKWAKFGKKQTDGVKIVFRSPDLGYLVGTAVNSFIDDLPVHGSFIAKLVPGSIITEKPSAPEGEFVIYPNPATGLVTVDLSGSESGQRRITIFNQAGQNVFEGIYMSTDRSATLDLKYLPKGVYTIEITDGQFTKKSKLLID